MRDDYLTREWGDNHRVLSDAIGRLVQTVAVSLERLNAKQFDAPWRRDTRERCG